METVAAAVAAGIAAGDLSPAARDIFTAVRRRLGAGVDGSPAHGNGANGSFRPGTLGVPQRRT